MTAAGVGEGVGPAATPSAPDVPTVGVEEEFFLLRPDGRTADVAPDVLAALDPAARATAEFSRCQVETSTGVCRDVSAVGRELAASRRAVAQAAAEHGARLAAVGTPPLDAPGVATLTDDERYRRLLAVVPGVTGEEVTCAGQVHVGVASRDLGVAVLARLRPWLPVLLALTGNSPFWRGRDTRWSSHRFVVQRRWPTFGPPPRCSDAADYDERVAELVASRAALDDRSVYFWARLSPRYPTVEVRLADACLTVADAVLLTALCRGAVMAAVDDELAGRPVPATPDRLLVTAGYSAARHGTSATVVDPRRDGWAPAVALVPELMARLGPALESAGDRTLVERLLGARLRLGSGADRQRALRRGTAPGTFVRALAETAGTPAP